MKVSLVALSQPAGPLRTQGIYAPEDLMVYTARVSNPSNQTNVATGERLLRYCLKNGHWSVFEQADMTVEIQTSRAIAAQILRHRSFTFQEFSQRYSEAPLEFEFSEARTQDPKNRQASWPTSDEALAAAWDDTQTEAFARAGTLYRRALALGVAKELARMVLPLATSTTLYMKGSVRSWIHYLQARTDVATQKEHREVAEAVLGIFADNFPLTARAAFGENDE